MQAEYPGAIAMLVGSSWVFADALTGLPGSELSLVAHKTASPGTKTAQSVATFFQNDVTEKKSVHFIVGLDGTIVQCVLLKDGAGGNCCLEDGHDSYWDPYKAKYGNLNKCTVSVEHVDGTLDNSQAMPAAQVTASFKLITWLCQRLNIETRHIKGHNTLDPTSRARCPGPTYPMDLLLKYVDQNRGNTMPLVLSPSGCVLDLVKSYQLDGGSQDKCGPWSVSELHYAGLPGKGAMGTPAQVQAWAHAEYTKYIGPDVLSDQNGSSIDNMHQFLKDAVLHWSDIPAIAPGSKQADDIARLHRALDAGYPVLVTVNEQSVKRRNGSNPYPWQPRLGPVNHIFTIVGHTSDGYLLVDDELNQSDSWPDQYSEASIECHWASVVQVVGPNTATPWLKTIPGDDPLQWPAGFNAQNFGGNTMGIPAGWKDDGTVLTAPNGHKVVMGFRKFILDGPWNPADVPQEEEHGQNPLEAYYAQPTNSGNQQVFLFTVLNYNAVRGVYKMGVGNEFLGLRRDLEKAQSQPPVDPQIADLQAQLAAALAKAGQLEATITKVKADLAA